MFLILSSPSLYIFCSPGNAEQLLSDGSGRWIHWHTWECRSRVEVSIHREIWVKWFLILLDAFDIESGAIWQRCHWWSAVEFRL